MFCNLKNYYDLIAECAPIVNCFYSSRQVEDGLEVPFGILFVIRKSNGVQNKKRKPETVFPAYATLSLIH